MAEKVEKDWRVENVENLKKKIEEFRKTALILMPVGIVLLVALFFHPFKIGFFGTVLWFVVSLGLSMSWYMSHAFKVVRAWEEGVIFRRSIFLKTVGPGWRLLLWPLDSMEFVPVNETKINPLKQQVFTKECITKGGRSEDKPMPAELDLVFWIKILGAAESIININNLKDSVLSLVLGIARTVIGGMSFEVAYASKEEIANKIKELANPQLIEWGCQITKLQVEDLRQSSELVKAQEDIQVSNKKREAAIIEAETKAQVFAILDKADPDMRRRGIEALTGFKGSVNIFGSTVEEIVRNITGQKK